MFHTQFTAANLFCAAVALHQVEPGLSNVTLQPLVDPIDQWHLSFAFSSQALANATANYSRANHPQIPALYYRTNDYLLLIRVTGHPTLPLITTWLPTLSPDAERAFIKLLQPLQLA